MAPEERAVNKKVVIGTLWEDDKQEYTLRWEKFIQDLKSQE